MVDGCLLTFKDFREYTATQYGCFTIVDRYLFLPRNTTTTTIVSVTFTKDTIIPVEDTDEMDFEPEYMRVLRFAVERALFAFREDERLSTIDALYKEAWKNYRSYIARQVDGTNNEVAARGYGRLNGFSRSPIYRSNSN